MATLGCMANRQAARLFGVAHETINRKLARLGRHCLLFHSHRMSAARPADHVVVDGFESFEWSQYYPFHHNVAVEKTSDFFLFFNDSELRRKGKMTSYQQRRRAQLEDAHGVPPRGEIGNGIREILITWTAHDRPLVVESDMHPGYRGPIRDAGTRVIHRTTRGRRRRTKENPLWEVNLLDLLIRHSSANHKRETIAWSKRRQRSAERLAILLVWRNYMKGRSEKQRGSPTPAMVRGMADHPLRIATVLQSRLFPERTSLPESWRAYYRGETRTRALRHNRKHDLAYGY